MKSLRKILGIKSKEEKEQEHKKWMLMKLNLKEKILGLTQPAVHLLKTNSKTGSKFGGKPIVDNPDFVWPRSNEKPMAFLAQINLNEISKEIEFEWLANKGSVLFFYDVREMPWGFDPKDRGKWKVIYQNNPSIELEPPLDLEAELVITEKFIKTSKVELLPSFEDKVIENLNLTDEETDLYIEIGEHYAELDPLQDYSAHQVGGFPRPVQGDLMQFEAEQASNGIYMGDEKGYKNTDDKDYALAKKEWKLLFQFDSDDDLDIMWGDLGMIYFWVERSKSKENNFEDVWLVLQCH